jgi:hypothetical protein
MGAHELFAIVITAAAAKLQRDTVVTVLCRETIAREHLVVIEAGA